MQSKNQTRFAIEFRALNSGDIPETYRLRRMLKYALRTCGLECKDYFVLRPGDSIRTNKRQPALEEKERIDA